MRIDPAQKWYPVYLLQPFYNVAAGARCSSGAWRVHDLDFDAIRAGEKDVQAGPQGAQGIAGKARAQITKDYIAWPLISGLVMTAIEARCDRRQGGATRAARQRARPQGPPSGAQGARAATGGESHGILRS